MAPSSLLMTRPIVVSGPSGAGKSTFLKRLFHEFPDKFGFSVSRNSTLHPIFTCLDTTRSPRSGETNGTEYFFVSREKFEQMIANGEFIEHAQFSGNYYGTSFMAVEQVALRNRICILDIEIQGARNVRKSHLDAVFCWVNTPSIGELERRLKGRGTENDESIQARVNAAKADLEALEQEPELFDCYIINDDLERAYEQFKKFVLSVNEQS